MGLLEALKESFTQSRQKAYADYAKLLAADSGTRADAARLRELMEQLKLSVDQVKADQQVLTQLPIVLGIIKRGTGLETSRQKAQRELDAFLQERGRIEDELNAKSRELNGRAQELTDRHFEAQSAIGRLSVMKRENPELLAGVPALTTDDLEPTPAQDARTQAA